MSIKKLLAKTVLYTFNAVMIGSVAGWFVWGIYELYKIFKVNPMAVLSAFGVVIGIWLIAIGGIALYNWAVNNSDS